ncbi:MAG: hypothetical protein K0R82_2525, partial [Flavipsychrobacter sp.]|nr:hypothetical protein [Flavipsychrobacter sp.]
TVYKRCKSRHEVNHTNTLGQVLYSGVVNSSKEVINISQFAPGSYVLQLRGSDGARNVERGKSREVVGYYSPRQ